MNFTTKSMKNISAGRKAYLTKKANQTALKLKLAAWFMAILAVTFIAWDRYTNYVMAEVLVPNIPFEGQNAPQGQTSGKNRVSIGEPSIQEYIFMEVERELGFEEAIKAVAIVQCESGFRPDIVVIEPNNTVSLGAWMINTVHNNRDDELYISNADKLDYVRATHWAIRKRIADNSWSAWMCS